MDLIADRFVIRGNGSAIDLASGQPAVVMVRDAPRVPEQKRWTLRCDRLFMLRQPSVAVLLDYGLVGEDRCFEAWDAGDPWRGSRQEAARATAAASRFLAASGLTDLTSDGAEVRVADGRLVVVPDAGCGFERPTSSEPRCSLPPALHGWILVDRPEVSSMIELFDDVGRRSPLVLGLCGERGMGLRTALQLLSRAARISGLVPLASTIASSPMGDLVRGRSLLIIDRFIVNQSSAGGRWRTLLDSSLRTPRAHIQLLAATAPIPRVRCMTLRGITAHALVDAVLPAPVDAAFRRRLSAAARRASGSPGGFIAGVWGRPLHARAAARQSGRSRAAEHAAAYGDEAPAGPPQRPTDGPHRAVWPVLRTDDAPRHRMEQAFEHLARGHRAAGDRLLRQAMGGFLRRHEWSWAARSGVRLAASLLSRGRAREADQVLATTRECALRAGHDAMLVDVGVLCGVAWIDLGRLEEAEVGLQAAIGAAEDGRQRAAAISARLALARCLFWRGRFQEADAALAPIDSGAESVQTKILAAVAASRAAIGQRDFAGGVVRANQAVEAASTSNDPSLVAHASYAAAFAHLAVGDRVALAHDLAACVRAARAARDPLRAVRARLVEAESARRAGREGAAVSLLRRLRRLSAATLPATVAARCALLADLLSSASSATPAEVVKRHVAATGLRALALFAPRSGGEALAPGAPEDLLEVLRCCQVAEEEGPMLTRVCGRLRERLGAAAIAFFAPEQGTAPLVADGGRVEVDIARRVVASGQAIAPHLAGERLEGGAPVRYGGRTLGALVGRWSLGASLDTVRASTTLTVAATAAAPALAALLAHEAQRSGSALDDLVGIGGALADVRRAVERAATAPFPVLIEGESGSGKELVARALHKRSGRRARPFCTVNCAALPDDLLEAELFGHSRGAFTGAIAERPGVFEEAHTGTLFLDEIGELSLRAQAKVLRVVQEGELRRVGENIARRIDVRLVSATNRALGQEVAAGRFRLDLFYRLNVIRIAVPPLRERREDVAALAERFWREAAERVGSRATLGSATIAALARHDWPGNVRELQNVLAALAVRCPRRGVIPPTALPPPFNDVQPGRSWRLVQARRTFEEQFVRAALVRTGGHRSRAAAELGLTRQGLAKLMARLGISDGLASEQTA
jgi:DNA-binding NtrC family response regulator